MKKRTLYLAVLLILLSWLIGPVNMLYPVIQTESGLSENCFTIVYPNGIYIRMSNVADGLYNTLWNVEVLVPEELIIDESFGISCQKGDNPMVMNFNPLSETNSSNLENRASDWIFLLFFGISGMIFGFINRASTKNPVR